MKKGTESMSTLDDMLQKSFEAEAIHPNFCVLN